LAALIVDALVLAVAVPAVALGPPQIWSALIGRSPGWLEVGSRVVATVLPLVYFTAAWWSTGQTLGDVVFGVVVRRRDGTHLGLGRALMRAFVGLLLPVVWLVGLAWIVADDRRRALHDRVFGTVVIRKCVELVAAGIVPVEAAGSVDAAGSVEATA
jgi:uncharacterized RDD family membrane protein YckC